MSEYFITLANGDRIPFEGSGLGKLIETISVTRTLTIEDSGKIFRLAANVGAQINLPAVPVIGMNYEFFIGSAFSTTNWMIAAASDNVYGHIIVDSTHVLIDNADNVSFIATAETIGDTLKIFFDGTNWIVFGSAYAAGGIAVV